MNRTLIGLSCVGMALALLLFSVWLSASAGIGGPWMVIILGLCLLTVGMLTLRGRWRL